MIETHDGMTGENKLKLDDLQRQSFSTSSTAAIKSLIGLSTKLEKVSKAVIKTLLLLRRLENYARVPNSIFNV